MMTQFTLNENKSAADFINRCSDTHIAEMKQFKVGHTNISKSKSFRRAHRVMLISVSEALIQACNATHKGPVYCGTV